MLAGSDHGCPHNGEAILVRTQRLFGPQNRRPQPSHPDAEGLEDSQGATGPQAMLEAGRSWVLQSAKERRNDGEGSNRVKELTRDGEEMRQKARLLLLNLHPAAA